MRLSCHASLVPLEETVEDIIFLNTPRFLEGLHDDVHCSPGRDLGLIVSPSRIETTSPVQQSSLETETR